MNKAQPVAQPVQVPPHPIVAEALSIHNAVGGLVQVYARQFERLAALIQQLEAQNAALAKAASQVPVLEAALAKVRAQNGSSAPGAEG